MVNLERLGEALAMRLEPVSTETPVGPLYADIVCSNLNDGSTVLIESQLERTDHRHLGQILTYTAGLDAVTIIWISPQFTEEHRPAIDWLNRITLDKFSFFAVEIELWRIGNSPPAPKFNIVAKPNDWTRAMRRKRPDVGADGATSSSFQSKIKNQQSSLGNLLYFQTPDPARAESDRPSVPTGCLRAGGGDPFWHCNSLKWNHFHYSSSVRTSCPENIPFHQRSGV